VSTDDPVPTLLAGLIDDAAVFPPGNAAVADALTGHTRHRSAWYSDLVGPLLLPVSILAELPAQQLPQRIGAIGDTGVAVAADVLATADSRWNQYEVPVAKRGEDPEPGLRQLLAAVATADQVTAGGIDIYAELPLTFGLTGALDILASERAAGVPVAAKFRTGGLAAELFPTPVELAAVICACRDRQLPYKLTAGLHHALRHTDPETGFTHHGFLNVLAADLLAAGGAEPSDVAEVLANVDPRPVLALLEGRLDHPRPLWVGFGSCSIDEPVADLVTYGLLRGGKA
jgi:hypothetical protein